MIEAHQFELFADYFQFYLEDEDIEQEHLWDEEKTRLMLATSPGVVALGTARNMIVPVRIVLQGSQPELDLGKWDKINEYSLRIQSGKIVVMGCCDYYPEAARIQVRPGVYRVRIHYGDLEKVSPDQLEGDEHYELILWPDSEERPVEKIK